MGGAVLDKLNQGVFKSRIAVILAVVLIVVPVLFTITTWANTNNPESYDGDEYAIEYNSGSGQSVILNYYGTPIAEYNPEYWSAGTVGSTNGTIIDWNSTEESETTDLYIVINWPGATLAGISSFTVSFIDDRANRFTISNVEVSDNSNSNGASYNINLISNGYEASITKRSIGLGYLSGYLVFKVTLELNSKIFGGWTDTNGNPVDPGDRIENISKLGVNWIYPSIFYDSYIDTTDQREVSCFIGSYCPYDQRNDYDVLDVNNQDSLKYSRIYTFNSDSAFEDMSVGTYRSFESYVGNIGGYKPTVRVNSADVNGEVLIDNLHLIGNEDGFNSHGRDTALYADGSLLILGTNIDCGSVSDRQGVQINGGRSSGDTDDTDLRVFSGTYSNIFGGSNSGNITGSTNVVIAGATITDTVYGGSMRGDVTETNVLIVKGDVCDESDWNSDGTINQNYRTVIGGSRFSGTVGESNVTISGTATVFAVQGGGRSSGEFVFNEGSWWDDPYYTNNIGTKTTETNVVVSGSSTVVYMVCGGVTDGRFHPDSSYYPVENSHVIIRDSPTVNDVYGGGWDTYNNPVGYSTRSTSVIIEGGTIKGSVYGGGFRGSIGSSGSEGQAVSIEISGGTIQGSVYGGGRGGDDPLRTDNGEKVAQEPNQNLYNDLYDARGNTTGRAYVDGDVEINITGGTIVGYVYGGGYGAAKQDGDQTGVDNAASVTGDVTISITGATINGAVFGGGRGISGNPSIAAVNAKEIRILVGDGATIGVQSTQYSVFGGGATAYTDANSVEITLGPSTINGDVHAGGFGTLPGNAEITESTGPIMSHDCDREVILNGATVNGSLYGGSRVGNDAPLNGTPSESEFGDITLNLEAGVVMENVFGGGFLGTSYMNVHILIGSSAVLNTGTLPYVREGTSPDLRINNVFGGGNLNSPGQSPFGPGSELLMGTVEISISGGPVSDGNISFGGYRMPGPGEESDVPKISIYGSIFGQGNFSAIGRTSSIEIRDYNQDNQYYIKSIQRANSLTIGDSSIIIEGSGDGLSTSVSVLVSINSITESMTLEGGVTLGLMAQTSAIGSLTSMVNGSQATESLYINGDAGSGNEIVLYDGRLLYVLGPNNTGLNDNGERVGIIEGYTMLSRPDGDNYFGAFAIGSLETNEDSGFIIDGVNGPEVASYIEGNDADPTKTWYIAGHISVGMVLTFGVTGDDGSQVWSASGAMMLPHLTEDSKLAYAASYADPAAQDGVLFLDSDDYSLFTGSGFDPVSDVAHRDFFSMTVSGSAEDGSRKSVNVRTHEFNQNSQGSNIERLERYYFNGMDYEATGNEGDFHIDIDATMLSSQYYGTYTIESESVVLGTSGNVGSIIIHLVEVTEYTVGEDTRYMPVNMVDVRVTLNVMPKADGLELPITIMTTLFSGRYAGTGYVILPAKGSRHTYTISNYTGVSNGDIQLFADSTYLSNQGWVSSNYMNSGLSGSDSDGIIIGEGGVTDTAIRIVYSGESSVGEISFDVTASSGTSSTVYHVTVNLIESTPVDLGLEYTDLDGNEFKVSVQYHGDQGGYYGLSWVPSTAEADSTIPIPYNSVLTGYEIRYDRGGTIEDGTVSEAMQWLLTTIPDYSFQQDGEVRSFVYADNLDGWYVEDTLMYELGSPLKESLTLTAKFGIRVTFHGENVTVTHQWVMIVPGTSLHYNHIGNPGDGYQITPWDGSGSRAGYHLGADHWVLSQDTLQPFDFDQSLYSDTDLYIPWVPNQYSMSISVSGVDPSEILGISGLSEPWTDDWTHDQQNNVWTTDVVVSYGSLVTVSVSGDSYRIRSAECTASPDVDVPIDGVPGTSMSFTVPNAGGHQAGTLSLELTISSGVSFTVDYLGETEFTNGLTNGNSARITVSGQTIIFQGSERQSGGVVVDSGTSSFVVGVPEGYWLAVWKDGVLLTEGTGGRVSGGAKFDVDIDSDTRIKLALYHGVELEYIDGGIGNVSVIPVDADGDEGVQTACQVGSVLFKGYVLIVPPKDGYVLPSSQTGTGSGVQDQTSTRYVVLGTEDVTLVSISTSVVLNITISLSHPDEGGALSSSEIRKLMGSSIIITLSTGATISVPITDSSAGTDGSVESSAAVDPNLLPSQATASLNGFSPDSKTINARPGSILDLSFDLVLMVYDVFYMSLDGSQLDQDTWSVVSESNLPGIDSEGVTIEIDGHQLWLSYSEGGFHTVEVFTTELFGNSESIRLFPVPPLTGSSCDVHEHMVVSTQSQLEVGVNADIGDSSFTIVMDGMTLSYDGSEKVLTLKGAGTGSFVFQNESVRIRVVSIADLHGDEGVAV